MLLKILPILAFACLGNTIPLSDNIETKIAGGVPVAKGEMPWMVSIQHPYFDEVRNICGGVLINATHVLTGAHCLFGVTLSYITLVAGATQIFANEETEQARRPVERIVHAYYERGPPVRHDLALLQVYPPFVLNEYVQPIFLPPRDHYASGNCTIAGWGATYSAGRSNRLLKTTVPIMSRPRCAEIYGFQYDQESQICAGYEEGGHDTCHGDTGGPLVCTDTLGYTYVAGISSWGGAICGEAYNPGVYSEVSHYTVGLWQPVHVDIPEE